MKRKTLTGKTVEVEVIKSRQRSTKNDIKYRITDGLGNSKVVTGERAMAIHRKTL